MANLVQESYCRLEAGNNILDPDLGDCGLMRHLGKSGKEPVVCSPYRFWRLSSIRYLYMYLSIKFLNQVLTRYRGISNPESSREMHPNNLNSTDFKQNVGDHCMNAEM